MAFCNSCGASLESGAKFCAKCGASQPLSGTVPVATPSTSTTAPSAAPAQGGSALKVILIVVAVIVALGIVGIGTLSFVAWRIARHTRVEERNGNVRVESPFGTVVESTTNPDDAAKNLGIDLYPGARLLKGNAANVSVAGIHTVAAEFESDDSVDKVAAFYQSKFPQATVSTKHTDHTTIISTDNKNLITINIEAEAGKTRIKVANVSGKGMTGGSSN